MTKKDIPSNWPGHLDTAVKYLNNCILLSIKYLQNEIMFGRPPPADSSENIGPPTEQDISIHFALAEQQRLDSYAAIVDHAVKRKAAFDTKLRERAPKNVVFQPGDLVQIHATEHVHTLSSIKKLIPMWSAPHRVVTKHRNSYTLETLSGLPLSGLYNSRRLRTFLPREGTKLAATELARMETDGEVEHMGPGEDDLDSSGG